MISSARTILARNMKRLRSQLNLSQENLADLCDLHRTYISGIECCNRNVSIDNVEKIANALHVTVSELLRSDTNDNP